MIWAEGVPPKGPSHSRSPGWREGFLLSLFLGSLAAALCLLSLPQKGWATSATWSGATNLDYNTLTNWVGPPASIPGTSPGETASFTNTGSGGVGISAATAHGVGLTFSNTSGHD